MVLLFSLDLDLVSKKTILDFYRENLAVENGFVPVGVDEVGRGPLAGPVVAAAVVFNNIFFQEPPSWALKVKDSKLLTPQQREELSSYILDSSVATAFGSVDVTTIDSVNIHTATLLAMEESLLGLPQSEAGVLFHVLIDGRFTLPSWTSPQEAIVDGDAKVFSIAAASIVAKVRRDAYMTRLSLEYPEYGFEKHKGYGTKAHLEAIEKYGLTKHHRKTFCTRFDQTGSLQ